MSGTDQALLTEMRKNGLFYAESNGKTQTPAKSRDKNDEGKRRASTTTQPTETTMNTQTVTGTATNGTVDIKGADVSKMSFEQQVDFAAKAAVQAAAQVQEMASLKHQAITVGATAVTTTLLLSAVFYTVKYFTSPSVA